LNVTTPPADFTIAATGSPLTVKRGSHGSYSVTLGTVSGRSSSVTLSVSGLPRKTSASFSANPVTTPEGSTLTISPSRTASTGTFGLTIIGNNGSFSHSTNVSLTIN